MDLPSTHDLQLLRSLIKVRGNVFAVRWEKDGKTGYMPAYDFDWNEYSSHKAGGGTLKDFKNKEYSKLTDNRIYNHLTGKETIGGYPLLPDNTSWFIVADFDEDIRSKRRWIDDCRIFLEACASLNLPGYLERSRSGKGGHVWIFFDQNYPAVKSRKIVLGILENAGILSPLDKNSNYDRLFPNQDFHSAKGLGNLIALPLQGKSVENQNSCFIDPTTANAYPDQWKFLQEIKKVSTKHLDDVFGEMSLVESESTSGKTAFPSQPLQVNLKNVITLKRNQLNQSLVSFLRDNLNFVNSDYIIKKRLGKSTYRTEAYFKMLEELRDAVVVPRGFAGKLLRYCKEKNLPFEIVDERIKLSEVNFSFKASLFLHQEEVLNTTAKKDMGVIVSPPGSGKTIIGLAIITQKKQPALIIVHRKQILEQWIERIQSFIGIADAFIGKIASGQYKIGTHVTVAMIQSIGALSNPVEFYKSFGTIIVDECHHVPAKTFRQVIKNFQSYYLYGLTATPLRKNNDEKLIFLHIGDVIHEVKETIQRAGESNKLSVIVRETNLYVPFDYKTDVTETISQILIHDTARNLLLTEDIKAEINAGRKVLVLTERKAHIDVLSQYLKNTFEVITISGEDTDSAKKIKRQQIDTGHFQVIISTGQFIGEGTDFPDLDCLVLAYPFAFEGKLIQYIGRVQRGARMPIIYDYRDMFIDYFEKLFRQRNLYYQKLLNNGQIHKYDELRLSFNEDKVYVNSAINMLSIACLDLPIEVEKFNEGVTWKVRVLNYDEDTGILTTEILDYQYYVETKEVEQGSFAFMQIEAIKFRAIDTTRLLRSVQLKQQTASILTEPVSTYVPTFYVPAFVEPTPPKDIEWAKPKEYRIIKTMKVPFDNLQFNYANVSFSIFIEEVNKQVSFVIDNPDIRPEFDAVKEYFKRVLKKKLLITSIEIVFTDKDIISSKATSEDISMINNSLIENVRFQFVKREILSYKGKNENNSVLHTLETLIDRQPQKAKKIFESEQQLIEDILAVKNSKHYHHLKFLASKHLSSILKIRFILDPFSFIFLLQGDSKYHIVWETLNSEEATYIWYFEKNLEALRKGLKEIEEILNEIKATTKQSYLKKEHSNFNRIIHDYTDNQKGFAQWKAELEVLLR